MTKYRHPLALTIVLVLLTHAAAIAQQTDDETAPPARPAARGQREPGIQRIVPLEHLDAHEAIKLIRQIDERCRAGADRTTNSLVLAGPEDAVETLIETLKELDAQSVARGSECSATIRVADAPRDLLRLIDPMVSRKTEVAFAKGAGILVLRGSCEEIQEVERLIETLGETAVEEQAQWAKRIGMGGLQLSFYFIKSHTQPGPDDRPKTHRPARAVDAKPASSSDDVLDRLIRVDFDDVGLAEAIDHLGRTLGINIVVGWSHLEAVGIDRDFPVTLQFMEEIPARRVLRAILDQVGGVAETIGYVMDGSVLKITRQAVLDRDVLTRVYNVQDLLDAIAWSSHPQTHSGSGDARKTGSDDDTGTDLGELIHKTVAHDRLLGLIFDSIAPDTWRQNGGTASAEIAVGKLVVSQTPSVHAAIAEVLAALAEREEEVPHQGVPLPPALEPVADALAEMGLVHNALLAPVTIHAQEDKKFEFIGWSEQPEGPIQIRIEGGVELGPTDELMHLRVSTGLVRKLGGSRSGFEHVFGIETTITARLGDFVVLATSPSSTAAGEIIVLAMRVRRGGPDSD